MSQVAHAKSIISSTALLELKLVEDGPASTKEQLLQSRNGMLPGNMEVVPGSSDSGAPGDRADTVYYLVRKVAVVTGRDSRTAKPTLDEVNRPAVSFSLNQDGARKFGKATGENIGRRLAIILDGRVQSAPVIEGRIFDEGRISGGAFTQQEVQDLSLVLRSGSAPSLADLPRGEHRRAVLAPTRSGPACWRRWSVWAPWSCSCCSTTTWRA